MKRSKAELEYLLAGGDWHFKSREKNGLDTKFDIIKCKLDIFRHENQSFGRGKLQNITG